MNSQIETQESGKPEIPSGYLFALILASLVMIGFASLSIWLSVKIWGRMVIPELPYMIAAGSEISHGLREFSGASLKELSPNLIILALLGFIAIYIVGPVLLLFALRRRWTPRLPATSRIRLVSVSSLCGGVIVGLFVLFVSTSFFTQSSTVRSVRRAQAIGYSRDLMIRDMLIISHDARAYKFRPVRNGGGGGRFDGYKVPADLPLSNIGVYNVEPADTILTVAGTIKTMPADDPAIEWREPVPDGGIIATVIERGFSFPLKFSGVFQ